jgi:hypothetical protein
MWPTWVVEGLAAMAEECIKFHARKRASVLDVLPKLATLAVRADNYTARIAGADESALVLINRDTGEEAVRVEE